jgi:hypothetical protein
MAVYFDAQSSLDFTTTANGSATHTPVGIPKGVLVLIGQNSTASDLISGVTYGGVAMTRLTNGFATDAATEIGACYAYFLGSNIPTGAQTVAATVSSGTDDKTWWCMTVTGSGNTEIAADGVLNGDQTNPSITLSTVAGYQGVAFAVQFSGVNAPSSITAGTGYTKFTNERDFGTQSAIAEYGQKLGENVIVNTTTATDDCAFIAGAIRQTRLPSTLNNYKHFDVENGISMTEKIY